MDRTRESPGWFKRHIAGRAGRDLPPPVGRGTAEVGTLAATPASRGTTCISGPIPRITGARRSSVTATVAMYRWMTAKNPGSRSNNPRHRLPCGTGPGTLSAEHSSMRSSSPGGGRRLSGVLDERFQSSIPGPFLHGPDGHPRFWTLLRLRHRLSLAAAWVIGNALNRQG